MTSKTNTNTGTTMTKTARHNSIDARNAEGQTIATHVYTGKTESARIKETNSFMCKWDNAASFKHHGDVTWIKNGWMNFKGQV